MSTASWIQPPCRFLPDRHRGGGGFAKPSFSRARQFPGVVSYSSSCSCGHSEILTFDHFGSNRRWNQRGLRVQAMSATAQRNFSLSKGDADEKTEPDHLLVLVHGILASPSDWLYVEAEMKRRLGRRFLIYASSSNTFTKTFGGVDGAGKRLAEEVRQVVQKSKSLKKISFLAHSLGGLFARHAVAVLYSAAAAVSQTSDGAALLSNSGNSHLPRGRIAGLEPINFITLATPHLGVRGRKQLPFLLGLQILERLAAPLAPFVVGRTGSQLFLTDGKADKPPLLLRMASDCEDLKFLSSLGSFRSRIVYANVSYDHMVGWRTSSIRRETELFKPPRRSLDGYKHVVDVEYCPPVSSDGAHFPPEAAKAKEAAQSSPSPQNTLEYHEIVEDEMIRGLQTLGWKKVDVSFHSTFWPYLAHNNIHVKSERLYKAGAGVVAHVADSIKQQESSTFIRASLLIMAKFFIVFLASALCFTTLLHFAAADADDLDRFHIKGSVYCDTCRVQFMTRLSKVLEGAKVKLECKGRENQTVTLTKEAVTDKDGKYEMVVMGDHEEEVCEIILEESPDAECSEVNNQEFLRNAARISLTANDGIVSNEVRTINPLGFMRKTSLADCPLVFKELGIVPDVIF
ncbi:Hydrolase-like protein family [Raphanus sativus]|nr:Hydrolase-like protein family [Raphanus sativus]